MTWTMPAAAAAFWGGLLLWEAHPPWLAPWMTLVLGLAGLVGAWLAAPRSARGPGALVEAGLVAADAPATEAVAGDRVERRGTAAPLALALAGVLAIGVGWGGLAAARLQSSLMGRLAPRRVEAVGSLREDPASGSIGWHAIVDVRQVSWQGGSATLRESIWLNADGSPVHAVRGDEVSFEGVLRVPGDPGFEDALHHKGIVVEVQAQQVERLGPASNPFVHATQVFRAFVGRSIGRLFPPREAGLLMGLALGDASRLDPGVARDFQATGLGHLLVVSGENIRLPCDTFGDLRESTSERPAGSVFLGHQDVQDRRSVRGRLRRAGRAKRAQIGTRVREVWAPLRVAGLTSDVGPSSYTGVSSLGDEGCGTVRGDRRHRARPAPCRPRDRDPLRDRRRRGRRPC